MVFRSHFTHNFRRYYDQCGDARRAIHMALQTTGRALLLTTLVLSAGFYVSASAYLANMRVFGLLAGSAILLALLSNLLLASALLVLATGRERPAGEEGHRRLQLVAAERDVTSSGAES